MDHLKGLVVVLYQTRMDVSLLEIMLLLILLTLCLLFRSNRLGLIVAFLFAYRWGWMLFDHLSPTQPNIVLFGLYFLFGAATALVAVVKLFFTDNRD